MSSPVTSPTVLLRHETKYLFYLLNGHALLLLLLLLQLLKGKERKEYLYSVIYTTHSLKAVKHGSHSFTCKLHPACLSFVSVHQMAPPLTEVADIQLQLTTRLSTPKG